MRSRIWFGILLLPALFWAGSLASVYNFSQLDETQPADAAVVLGAAVFRGRPSPVFEQRIRHGVNLYQDGTVDALIFTGSIGRRDELSEAAVGQQFAESLGVPAEAIFIEEISTGSFENLMQAKMIVNEQGFGQVLLVSDPMHMKRAVTMAGDLGIEALSSPTPTSRYVSLRSRLFFLIRETYSYSAYLLARPFVGA